MATFLKAMRSEEATFLDLNPNANHLLNVIARRSRRSPCLLNKLDIGECFVGFKSVGLTEQQYRTAKKHLEKMDLVAFRVARRLTGGVTSGVTVARLMNTRVYDTNTIEGNATPTPKQRQPNANLTSNKECKNERTKDIVEKAFLYWWDIYPVSRRKAKGACLNKFKVNCKGMGNDQVTDFVNRLCVDTKKRITEADDIKFIPATEPYLNQKRWEDFE